MLDKLDFLKLQVNNIKETCIDDKIYKLVLINKNELYLFMLKTKKIIHISFNFVFPYINIVNKLPDYKKDENNNLQLLKKYLLKATIQNLELLNNDKIIQIQAKKVMEDYEVLDFYIYLELFSNHPNLIIASLDDKILFARHYTSLNAVRIINKNMEYELPQINSNQVIKKAFDSENFIKNYECQIQLDIIKSDFKDMFKLVKNKIKQLNKKINILNQTILTDQKYEAYKKAADYIYTNLDENFDEILIDGIKININKQYSLIENANIFYKKYKKMKTGIQMNKEFLQAAQNELEYFEYLNEQITNKMLSYNDILEINLELIKNNYLKNKDNKKIQPSYLPYKYSDEEIVVYFGNNYLQNNYLTFEVANKNDLFIHVKDYHGSHVILPKQYINNKNIEKCCKIALFLSNLTQGELNVAEVRNVKKTNIKGLVNLLSYKSYYVKINDTDEIQKIISNSKKVK